MSNEGIQRTGIQLIPGVASWKKEIGFRHRNRLFILPPLPNGDVVSTTELLLREPRLISRKPIFRLGISIVENPTPETDQALTMLGEDLGRFRVEEAVLSTDALQDLDCRMDNIQTILFPVFTQTENTYTELTLSQKRLFDAYMRIRNDAIHVFSGMGTDSSNRSSDLIVFLNYAEFARKYSVLLASHPQSRKKLQTFQHKDGVKPPHQFMNIVQENEQAFSKAAQEAWDRLRKGWDWNTIKTIVSYLPRLAQPTNIAVMTSVWDNLSALPYEAPQEGSVKKEYGWLLGTTPLFLSHPNLFLPLLEHGYPDIVRAFQSSADSALPASFPIVLKNLLSKLKLIEGEESMTRALISIHKGVGTLKKDPQLYRHISSRWLTVLLAIKSEFSSSHDIINDLVGSLGAVGPQLRQIALDQQPGTLYLTSDGDVISQERAGAFLLHTSSKPAEPQPEAATAIVPETPKEVPAPILIRITEKPFVGAVDVVEDQSVPQALASLFERTDLAKDGDALLDAFDTLSEQWKNRLISHATLVYLAELNRLDPACMKAEKMGISAVIIDRLRNTVTFLLNGQKTAIEGALTLSGELQIKGADGGFTGSEAHLYLNTLALDLSTRVFYQGVPKDNTVTASWNRHTRGERPKLRKATLQDNTSVVIPATFAKDELQILLIEESLKGKQG